MDFSEWLEQQDLSPISPEACYAEQAWKAAYSEGYAKGLKDNLANILANEKEKQSSSNLPRLT